MDTAPLRPSPQSARDLLEPGNDALERGEHDSASGPRPVAYRLVSRRWPTGRQAPRADLIVPSASFVSGWAHRRRKRFEQTPHIYANLCLSLQQKRKKVPQCPERNGESSEQSEGVAADRRPERGIGFRCSRPRSTPNGPISENTSQGRPYPGRPPPPFDSAPRRSARPQGRPAHRQRYGTRPPWPLGQTQESRREDWGKSPEQCRAPRAGGAKTQPRWRARGARVEAARIRPRLNEPVSGRLKRPRPALDR